MRRINIFFAVSAFAVLSAFSLLNAEIFRAEKIDIDKVWAGHPVNFSMETKDDFQCVAYYDTTQRMIVAARNLGETTWDYTKLSTKVGWDSHNYIDMAIDDSGYVHVSGNMHNVNLIYYRSKKAWSIEEFEQPGMVGSRENSVTYPVFIKGPGGKLIFQYRDGGSGDGVTIWNGYDLIKKRWWRITDKGLFDNAGSVNAYSTTPVLGPDSCFHIIWMWRDSPNANTNHDLSHMKTSDLVNWKNIEGKTVSIPVSQYNTDVVVDPVESRRGLINMDFWVSWDRQDRAVVTYHRYDENNVSQIYNTRWEDGGWKVHQTSSWTDFKWYLDLEGSLTHDIAATPITIENGKLVQDYVYPRQEIHRWTLDEETLRPENDEVYRPPQAMEELHAVESDFPGMQVNRIHEGEYHIKWESMPINQDKARSPGTYPSSSFLRLYKYETPSGVRSERYTVSNERFTVDKNRFRIVINNSRVTTYRSFDVVLYSLNGSMVLSEHDVGNCCVMSIASIPRGVYILNVAGGNTTTGGLSEILHIY